MNKIIIKLVSLLVCAVFAVVFNSCSSEEEFQSVSKNELQNLTKQKQIIQQIVNSSSYENYIYSAISLYENLNFSFNSQALALIKTEKQLKDWMVLNQKNTNFSSVSEFELFMNAFKNYHLEFKNEQQNNLSEEVMLLSKTPFKETFIATLHHNEETHYENLALSDCGIQAVNGIRNVRNNAIFNLVYLKTSDKENLNLEQLFTVFTTYNNSVSKCSDLLSDCLKTQ